MTLHGRSAAVQTGEDGEGRHLASELHLFFRPSTYQGLRRRHHRHWIGTNGSDGCWPGSAARRCRESQGTVDSRLLAGAPPTETRPVRSSIAYWEHRIRRALRFMTSRRPR
jgi:hypothetical protein